MRTTTTLLFGLLSATALLRAQAPGDSLYMFFDDPSDDLQLDSVYPAGCWQVGTPAKPVFTSAYSPGKALVTDTLLPYPDSTTCYAEFTLISTDFNFLGRSVLFQQRLDLSPGDSASVEIYDPWQEVWRRFGTGWDEWAYVDGTWQMNDGTGFAWSDTASLWQQVWLESPCIGVMAGQHGDPDRWYEPEMRLRFALHSSVNTQLRDGWMIDDVRAGVSLCAGGFPEGTASALVAYPDPADGQLTLETLAGSSSGRVVEVRAPNGTLAARLPWQGTRSMVLNTAAFPSGLYLLRVLDGERIASGRIVIQH